MRSPGKTISRWAFAGLWEGYRWPDGTVTRSFYIVTTAANAEMAELHDRMPVIPSTIGKCGVCNCMGNRSE